MADGPEPWRQPIDLVPEYCVWAGMVKRLAKLLEVTKALHFRGTLASGKSSVAQLLQRFLVQNGMPALYIKAWRHKTSAEEYLSTWCNQVGLKILPEEVKCYLHNRRGTNNIPRCERRYGLME